MTDPTEDGDGDYAVKSVKTSYEIVEVLRSQGPLRLSEIVAELDVTKGAVHQHLQTLQRLGYVVKQDTTYTLGLQYLALGDVTRNRHPVYEIAKRELRKLAKTCGETATLMIFEEGYGIYVFHSTGGGKELPRRIPLGERVPLVESVPGKSILSELPTSERRTHVSDEIWAEIEQNQSEIQGQGLVVGHDRETETNAIGRAILDDDGRPIGAISIVGSVDELRGRRLSEDVIGMVVNTVRSIQMQLTSE
jgi:DNA-binding IclR family transcriptional regulator